MKILKRILYLLWMGIEPVVTSCIIPAFIIIVLFVFAVLLYAGPLILCVIFNSWWGLTAYLFSIAITGYFREDK